MNQVKICGVYYIENRVNGKVYVGGSKNIPLRIKEHISLLFRESHTNPELQEDFLDYGFNNFSFRIVETTDEVGLLDAEQRHLDTFDFKILYNKESYAKGGIGKPVSVFVLDLRGNILERCSSGSEAAKYMNRKVITYSTINTPHIYAKKYRVVTVDFYEQNKDIIENWKFYSNETVYKTVFAATPKFKAERNGTEKYLKTYEDCGRLLGVSCERARQIIPTRGNKWGIHKKTGWRVRKLKDGERMAFIDWNQIC